MNLSQVIGLDLSGPALQSFQNLLGLMQLPYLLSIITPKGKTLLIANEMTRILNTINNNTVVIIEPKLSTHH